MCGWQRQACGEDASVDNKAATERATEDAKAVEAGGCGLAEETVTAKAVTNAVAWRR